MPNVRDRNAGFATGQEQVWGFDKRTGIDSKSYGAPGAKIFYVDPNNTLAVDAGNLGEDPTVPLATVAAAVALCRDHMGDTIIVADNDGWQHAPGNRGTAVLEEIVIPYTKGGIRIVGMSPSSIGVPWIPITASGVCITVHAIDVLIEGFCFWNGGGVATPVGIKAEWNGTTYGDNLTVRNCFFEGGLDYGIQLDFSYYCDIYNNHFEGCDTAAIHNLDVAGDPDYCKIHGNTFDSNTAAIDLEDSDSCFIWNNLIYGDGTGTNNFIDLTGGGGNIVVNNYLACTIAQYDVTCSDATSGAWVNNHCTNGDTTAPPV